MKGKLALLLHGDSIFLIFDININQYFFTACLQLLTLLAKPTSSCMTIKKAPSLLPTSAMATWQRWGSTLTYQKLNENYHTNIPRIAIRRRSWAFVMSFAIITLCLFGYAVQYLRLTSMEKSRQTWLFTRFPELQGVWKDVSKDESKYQEAIMLRWDNRDIYSCDNYHLSYSTLNQIINSEWNIGASGPITHQAVRSPHLILPPFDPSIPVTLKPNQTYCVRVVVPAQLFQLSNINAYNPIDGSPWDSIMMTAVRQSAANTTVPINLKLWRGHAKLYEANEQNAGRSAHDVPLHELVSRSGLHVYEAELALADEGNYSLETRLEYTQGLWNFERETIISYQPEMVKPPSANLTLRVLGRDMDHFDLPLCTRGDHPGRWLNLKDYEPERRNMIEPSAVDFQGNFWAPYNCRYRHIPYQDFTQCMAKKYPLVHWFGDSNSRRAIKKMVTDGEWCGDYEAIKKNATLARSCHCEDYHDMTWNSSVFDPWSRASAIKRHPLANVSKEWGTVDVNAQSEVWFYKMDGLTNLNEPAWEESFIDYPPPENMVVHIPGLQVDEVWNTRFGKPLHIVEPMSSETKAPEEKKEDNESENDNKDGINQDVAKRSLRLEKRWYLTLAPPQVLMVSLGNWDTSWMPYADYQIAVQKLVNYIKQRYVPYKTAVIYRAPQYYCCRVDTSDWQRRLSTRRMEAYDRYARDMLTQHVGAKVWDVYALGEARSWQDKQASTDCPSNHVSSDLVAVENQVLMNSLCNVDDWFADV